MSSSLQSKLLEYEAYPSAEVWHRLAQRLDEENSVSLKMHAYQQAPPAFIWEKIAARINRGNAAVIPFYQRYRKPLRYSGVLVAFVLFAFVTSLLIGKKTISEERPGPLQANALRSLTTRTEDITEKKSSAKKEMRDKRLRLTGYKTTALNRLLHAETQRLSIDIKIVFPGLITRKSVFSNPASDHYIVYSDDSGKAVRLSKKLYEVFSCPFKDQTCNEKIQNLQRKSASSALASDFTGILDILNNLGENQ